MKLLKFIQRKSETKKYTSFSDFLLHASEREKNQVFVQAAEKANKEQRETVRKARNLGVKTG